MNTRSRNNTRHTVLVHCCVFAVTVATFLHSATTHFSRIIA